jgi:hypothetical protein
LSDGETWLTTETYEYLQALVMAADYKSITMLTDNERAISNLRKVEPVIMRSKYINKATIKPNRALTDIMQFDASKVQTLGNLRDLPIIITIDSGEGRLSDYTVASFWLPEYSDGKEKMLQDAYEAEMAEIELNANEDSQYYDDEDAALDAMCDVEDFDVDSLTNDFLSNNAIRCRQIGVLSTNQHCMAMVALFIQVFVKFFMDPEKVKVICELDGIGSKMQALLATDIIKNSSFDLDEFGSVDGKHPGILMRGRNKQNYVYDTSQLLEDNRILATYGPTVYEVTKFAEVKPGKFMGVNAHDDHAMNVVHIGGYMMSQEFAVWVDDIFTPDEELEEVDDT